MLYYGEYNEDTGSCFSSMEYAYERGWISDEMLEETYKNYAKDKQIKMSYRLYIR